MSDLDDGILGELKARLDIQQCLLRYCRGLDRGDRTLMMSAYHPNAVDEHGLFNGPAAKMVEWAISSHLAHLDYFNHHIMNMYVEVEGDAASAETYVGVDMRFHRDGKAYDFRGAGRYLDRFECRGGRWKIAHRLAIGDWGRVDPVLDLEDVSDLLADRETMRMGPSSTRSPDDPSYRYFRKSESW